MNRNTHTNTDTGEVIGTTATGQAAEATARQLLDALSRRGRAAAAASVVGARAFEPLEQRQMMSAAAEGVSFADGVLTVRGSHANANDLSVRLSDDGREIWGVANNTAGDHIDVSSVRQIRIYGGEDADAVNVDARIRIPVLVRTGNGFDQITTAAGRDTIVSGNGNDSVNSGGGNDVVRAGNGRDSVYAGAGNDSVDGGSGIDRIDGGGGDDSIHGDGGGDDISGGRGRDLVYTGAGYDCATGGPGDDTIVGDAADPRLIGGSGDNVVVPSRDVTGYPILSHEQAPAVTGFSLFDAAHNRVIPGYENMTGAVSIDWSKLPTQSVSIHANVAGGAAGSVRMSLDGKLLPSENQAPYEVYGQGWSAAGTHTLSASAYTGAGATGDAGTGLTLNLTIRRPVVVPPVSTGNDGNNDAAAPVGVIKAISTTVAAGQAVHVQATGSDLKVGTPNTGVYVWDFGDAGSKYNTLRGFNAAHLYEQPGTYTVKLTLTNSAGKTSVTTQNVTVTAANRKVIYVSPTGSDSNTGRSPQAAVKTLAKAATMLGDNTEILLQRGGTYNVGEAINLKGKNVVVDSYGTGNRPRLEWTGGAGGVFFTAYGTDVVVRGMSFNDARGQANAVNTHGTNFTAIDNEFLHMGQGVNNNGGPTGVLIQDNVAPLADGVHGSITWVQGSDLVIVGNTMANSTAEHCIRDGGADRVLVAFNTLTNLDRRPQGVAYDYAKQTLTLHVGNYNWVYGNTFSTGRVEIGPLGGADGMNRPDRYTARLNYTVVEGNILKDGAFVAVVTGANHTTIRNNAIYSNDTTAISVEGYSTAYQRDVEDLTIEHNTAINNGTHGNFLWLLGSAKGLRVTDNLFVAPKLQMGVGSASGMFVSQKDLSSFAQIDGNVWPAGKPTDWAQGGSNYVGTSISSAGYQTQGEWNALPQVGTDVVKDVQLGSGSYAIGTGTGMVGAAAFPTLRLAA